MAALLEHQEKSTLQIQAESESPRARRAVGCTANLYIVPAFLCH